MARRTLAAEIETRQQLSQVNAWSWSILNAISQQERSGLDEDTEEALEKVEQLSELTWGEASWALEHIGQAFDGSNLEATGSALEAWLQIAQMIEEARSQEL